MSEEKRGVGRPPKPKDLQEILEKESIESVLVAQELRKFSQEQLRLLIKDAEGITNIGERQKVLKTVMALFVDMMKNIKAMTSEVDRQPKEDEENFNLE